ncbi:MAG: glycosyltransferase [Phycisphaerae bacterium]|nr:glycosyltransferase [Phycisphaerae bacterium]
MSPLGVVVIGRNEGERLPLALQSVLGKGYPVVYVDSGSADGSVAVAHSLGADVVELDAARPFTAARARNAGLARLLERSPGLEFVQFVDGDCEMVEGWFEVGLQAMADRPDAAAVFGRVRERHPEASLYNRLCDLDWDRPLGAASTCGGISLMRVAPLLAVEYFNESLIAGEEPELCYRMRQSGWVILRLLPDMAHHDAAMLRFSQWWKREVRTGHAYAEGAAMHGHEVERYAIRSTRSALFWGLLLPLFVAVGACIIGPGAFMVTIAYFVLWLRTYFWVRGQGHSVRLAALSATFVLLGKLPEGIGVVVYHLNHLRGRRTGLIEYKALGYG